MTKSRLLPSLILIAVLLAACAPDASTVAPAQPEAVEPSPTTLPATDLPVLTTAAPTQALATTAMPVATSRGPELHATDPLTVTLASGGLQLVEFFRFT